MKIKKEAPSWLIIGDTKVNQQSFQKYSDGVVPEFETAWIKANGKAQQVSVAEKMLELLATDFTGIKNDKGLPNSQFVEANIKAFEPLFDHFSITIVFNEVSHLFLQNLILEKLVNFHINQKRSNDMSLWLPPAFEHPIAGNTYGAMIGDIAASIEKFITTATANGVSLEEATKTAFSMMPLAQHSKVIVTASIGNWRRLLITLSDFNKDIETRFIVLNLCRDLKMRYLGFFCDLAVQTKDGKLYGVDTLTNEGIWKTVRITKK
jgi:hypothetical protein